MVLRLPEHLSVLDASASARHFIHQMEGGALDGRFFVALSDLPSAVLEEVAAILVERALISERALSFPLTPHHRLESKPPRADLQTKDSI
jgi:hypothetical protein